MSGVAGATLLRVAKPAEVGNKPKQELLSDMRKMEELFVLEKICKNSTVILRTALKVIVLVHYMKFEIGMVIEVYPAICLLILHHFLYISS